MAQDYCWIHGTSYIPPQYQPHMKCIVELEGVESVDDAPDTAYYQWVTFIMAIHAGVFYAPYYIWSILENGLIGSFGTDGKTTVMISEEQKYDDGVVIEAVVERYTKYFKSIFHHNNWYFGYFVFCEFLNFLLMIVQFWLIDSFLNNKFRWFGLEVVEYYSWSFRDRQNRDLMLRSVLIPAPDAGSLPPPPQESPVLRLPHRSLLQHPQHWRRRQRAGAQRTLCAHTEYHQ